MVLPVQPVEYGVTVKQLLHTKAFLFLVHSLCSCVHWHFMLCVYLQYPGELYIAPNRVCNLIRIVFQGFSTLCVSFPLEVKHLSASFLFLFKKKCYICLYLKISPQPTCRPSLTEACFFLFLNVFCPLGLSK